jgi:sodium/proline symporter
MSTASAQLLVASSALANDLYRSLWRRDASRTELLWVGRMAVLLIASLAIWFARNPENTVLSLVAWAWAGFGAAFGPVVILSLYWKSMTRAGALAGILVGGMTVVLWKQLAPLGDIFELYELVPGFLFSIAAITLTSRLTGNQSS